MSCTRKRVLSTTKPSSEMAGEVCEISRSLRGASAAPGRQPTLPSHGTPNMASHGLAPASSLSPPQGERAITSALHGGQYMLDGEGNREIRMVAVDVPAGEDRDEIQLRDDEEPLAAVAPCRDHPWLSRMGGREPPLVAVLDRLGRVGRDHDV